MRHPTYDAWKSDGGPIPSIHEEDKTMRFGDNPITDEMRQTLKSDHETRALRDALVHEARGVLQPASLFPAYAYGIRGGGSVSADIRDANRVVMVLDLDTPNALRVAALLGDLLGGGR